MITPWMIELYLTGFNTAIDSLLRSSWDISVARFVTMHSRLLAKILVSTEAHRNSFALASKVGYSSEHQSRRAIRL